STSICFIIYFAFSLSASVGSSKTSPTEAYFLLMTISSDGCRSLTRCPSEALTHPMDFLKLCISVLPKRFPSTDTSPVVGHIYPFTMLSKLVLPAPFNPSTDKCSCLFTCQSILWSISFPSLLHETLFMLITCSIFSPQNFISHYWNTNHTYEIVLGIRFYCKKIGLPYFHIVFLSIPFVLKTSCGKIIHKRLLSFYVTIYKGY